MMGEGKYSDRRLYAYPTFITTDLKMPGADGFAVLEHLKNNPEWAVIPTVVLTGSRDLDDIKKSYMLGASSYHVKPGDPERAPPPTKSPARLLGNVRGSRGGQHRATTADGQRRQTGREICTGVTRPSYFFYHK